MNNYGNALKYTEVAANSSGTALEKFGSYQEGIEAKTKKAQAAFEELSMALINSDVFGMIIDLSRKSTEGITGLVKMLGGLPVAMGAISVTLSALGKNAGKQCA